MKRSHSSIACLIPQLRVFERSHDMLNTYISICTRPMTTKHVNMGAHSDRFPPIDSHNSLNSLNMCSREVTWQIKNIYVRNQNAYGQKTYQRSDIIHRAPTTKFPCPLNEITHIISPPAKKPINTKLCKVLTYIERIPLLKPHDTWITWPTRAHMKISKILMSTITRIMTSKTGRMLTYASRFSM